MSSEYFAANPDSWGEFLGALRDKDLPKVAQVGAGAGLTRDEVDLFVNDSSKLAQLALRVAQVASYDGPAHEVAGW